MEHFRLIASRANPGRTPVMNKPADLPTPMPTAVTGRHKMTPSEAFAKLRRS